uniref:Uncharacterized protein n=1 Tax=viral metagenome TaxID=1070528 RepID=A0A6C0JYW7_9ZZZZ
MQIPSVCYPYIISAYTKYASLCNTIQRFVGRLTVAYETLFTPRIYVFYKGYLQPVPYKHNADKDTCHLFYDVDRSLFYTGNNWSGKNRALPILSMEVRDMSNNLMYDLTDFVNDLRFVQTQDEATPSLSSIIMIWATLNDIYFDPSFHRLQYIDCLGNTIETNFTDLKELVRH